MILKSSLSSIFVLAVLACCADNARSAKEDSALIKLTDDVYVQLGTPDGNAVSNSGVVLLEKAVLVFDTHFTPEAGQLLLTEIRSLTSKPVAYVVNSHSHPDHTHGNQVFAGAQIISSSNARRDVLQVDLPSMNRTIGVAQAQVEKLRRELKQQTEASQAQRIREQIRSREDYLATMSRLKITAPVVTLDDSLILQDGKRELRILYLGAAHTDGDIILFLPSAKIVFLGDLFFNEALPNVQDANIFQWMKTLEQALLLDADKFVPGHGPVGSRKDVERFLGYFEELKSLVEPYVARGDSLEQATREMQIPNKFSGYQFQNFFPANVQKMYAEVKAHQISSIPAEGPKKEGREKSR